MDVREKLNCIDVLAPTEKLLRLSGIWPVKQIKINYLIRTIISWIFSYILLGLMCAEVIHVMGDMKRVNEIACTLTPVIVYCFKMTALVYYRKNFFNIVETLNSDLFNKYSESMQRPLQKILKVTNQGKKIFHILTLSVIIFYTVFPIFDEKELPIPFSFNVGRYRYVMHIFQIVTLSLSAWNLTSIDRSLRLLLSFFYLS